MKATIDEKENTIGERATQQLTEDELEFASGGEGEGGQDRTCVCSKCGFVYFSSGNSYEREYYRNYHRQLGCDEPI